MRYFRKVNLIILAVIILFMVTAAGFPVASVHAGTTVFSDDFEEYAVGSEDWKSAWGSEGSASVRIAQDAENNKAIEVYDTQSDNKIRGITLYPLRENVASWQDYSVEADITVLQMGAGQQGYLFGLNARYADPGHKYSFRYFFKGKDYTGGYWWLQIHKKGDNGETVLAEKELSQGLDSLTGSTFALKGIVNGNQLDLYVNGNLELTALDEEASFPTGSMALNTFGASIRMDKVAVNDLGAAGNQSPTADDISANTSYDTPVSDQLQGYDPDGDLLSYSIGAEPSNGTAAVTEVTVGDAVYGNWTYTPNVGYSGTDYFIINVSDGKGGVTQSTVQITVLPDPDNASPVVTDYNYTTSGEPVTGKVDAVDEDGDVLTFLLSSDVPADAGTVVLNESTGNFTYTPAIGFSGTASFVIRVLDGKGGLADSTVTVTIPDYITVKPDVIGHTPLYIGQNLNNAGGQQYTESNIEWMKNSGINAARQWMTIYTYEPENDNLPYGNGVTDQASFEAAKAAVSANPETNPYINWDAYDREFQEHLIIPMNLYKENGITPLIDLVLQTSNLAAGGAWLNRPLTNYEDYWEYWEYCFALSYYIYKNYGFLEYELENEPNMPDHADTRGPDDFLYFAYYGSDGIRSGVKAAGSTEEPTVFGPTVLTSDNGKFEQYLHEFLPMIGPDGKPADFYLDGISYHSYRVPELVSGVPLAKSITEKMVNLVKDPLYNPDGHVEDLYISEGNLKVQQLNVDNPNNNARLPRLLMELVDAGKGGEGGSWLRGYLQFRFAAEPFSFYDNTSVVATRESGLEYEREHLYFYTLRMLMDALNNKKDILDMETSLPADRAMVTKDDNFYYVLTTNIDERSYTHDDPYNGGSMQTVVLDTSALGITSAPVYIRTINSANWGTISEGTVQDGKFTYTIDPSTFMLLKIPVHYTEKTIETIDISPSDELRMKVLGAKNFKAVAEYSDGSQEDISDRVTWRSSVPGNVRMIPTGLAYGITSNSSAVLTAEYKGVTSNAVTFHVLDTVSEAFSADNPSDYMPAGWANISGDGSTAIAKIASHSMEMTTQAVGSMAGVQYDPKSFNLMDGPVAVEIKTELPKEAEQHIVLQGDQGNEIRVIKQYGGELLYRVKAGNAESEPVLIADTNAANALIKIIFGAGTISIYENHVHLGTVDYAPATGDAYNVSLRSVQNEASVAAVTTKVYYASFYQNIFEPASGTSEAVTLSGSSTAVPENSSVSLQIGLSGVSGITGEDITVSYDPQLFSYVADSAVAMVPGADYELKSHDPAAGTIRFLVYHMGADQAITGTAPILKLDFTAKAGTGEGDFRISNAVLSSGAEGQLIVADTASAVLTVQVVSDIAALHAAIASAGSVYDQSEAGIRNGQYPEKAKTALLAAINAAEEVEGDPEAGADLIALAVQNLNAAVEKFQSLIITDRTGDLNQVPGYDIGDIGIVAWNYGLTPEDADWDPRYDLDGDEEIGLWEITFIARRLP